MGLKLIAIFLLILHIKHYVIISASEKQFLERQRKIFDNMLRAYAW